LRLEQRRREVLHWHHRLLACLNPLTYCSGFRLLAGRKRAVGNVALVLEITAGRRFARRDHRTMWLARTTTTS